MKKFTVPALAFALVIVISAGCKKSNENGTNTAGIGATIGGTAWQSQAATGLYYDSFIRLIGAYVKNGDSTAIEIDISDTTHLNQPDPFAASSVYYSTQTKYYSGDEFTTGHGTITVTAWDKTAHTIAGTFSGVFHDYSNIDDSITVANGHFNSTYLVP
jgi:hypothetical protein